MLRNGPGQLACVVDCRSWTQQQWPSDVKPRPSPLLCLIACIIGYGALRGWSGEVCAHVQLLTFKWGKQRCASRKNPVHAVSRRILRRSRKVAQQRMAQPACIMRNPRATCLTMVVRPCLQQRWTRPRASLLGNANHLRGPHRMELQPTSLRCAWDAWRFGCITPLGMCKRA